MKKARRSSKPILTPVTLAVAGIALLVVAIGIVMLNSGESEPDTSSSNQASNELSAGNNAPGIPYPDVPRVSLADAKAQYDADSAIFVDVRSSQEYAAAHIPEAISLPLVELEARHQELPADALIFLYCT